MSNELLRAENMTVGYGGVPLIRDIALSVSGGEILTLIGPNGSGKSTILKSLIRELALLGGTVYLDGRDSPPPVRERNRTHPCRHDDRRLTPERMTCWDVAAAGRYPYTGRLGLLGAEDREKVREALALVHAEDFADRDFACVSDGQRQRILLARAICQQPRVLVLDEPTSFLDIRYKLELLTILKKLVREQNVAVVLSLHELDLAQKISDRVVCVKNGEITCIGTPEEVFANGSVRELYGLTAGSYDERFGSLELEPVRGEPQALVVGGGGSGIALYRALQRQAVPFAAGVLHESDMDFPVASALACRGRVRAAVSADKRRGVFPRAGNHAPLPPHLCAAPRVRPDERKKPRTYRGSRGKPLALPVTASQFHQKSRARLATDTPLVLEWMIYKCRRHQGMQFHVKKRKKIQKTS